MYHGQIIKSTGGLYTVECPEITIGCRPRGIFRKDGTIPYVGDRVEIVINPEGSGTITVIKPRENSLIRPPVANLEHMVLVCSTTDPVPNLLVIDKFLATMASHGISTIITVTKPDLATPDPLVSLYQQVGYPVFVVNTQTGEGVTELVAVLAGKLSAFAGNTGAGKSSLLNAIDSTLNLPVGETSKKLGRGRHTTRHVEVFTTATGLRIADTPGFSSMDIIETTDVTIHDLDSCFTDFRPYLGSCKFNNCKHLSEGSCGVKAAVEEGTIAASRYQSYTAIYNEIKDVKEWDRR